MVTTSITLTYQPKEEGTFMKLKSIFMTSALAASCLCLRAQETPRANEEMPPVYVYGPAEGATKGKGRLYAPVKHFTELVGLEVRNFQNEELGKIRFVTVDLENARVVDVVITSGGGFFRRDTMTTAVPPLALKFDANSRIARLNMSKARFDAASRFITSDAAAYSNRERVAAVMRYFGQEPWFFHEGQVASKNGRLLNLGHVRRTESIVGLQIKNTRGQYLGWVSTLMIDLPKGRVVHVVNETESMDGEGSLIIQPGQLRYNHAHNGLVLDKSFVELKEEPRFKWGSVYRNTYQEELHANRAASSGQGGITRKNEQQPLVRKVASIQQGKSLREAQKPQRSKHAISSHSKAMVGSAHKTTRQQSPGKAAPPPSRQMLAASQ
ncbi:MAG TPA: hypothetical protein DDZ88_29190 [Verrucomicrobiales bacterium]|nr:hypothetical protein [Verrucomicrobiales bacterium]